MFRAFATHARPTRLYGTCQCMSAGETVRAHRCNARDNRRLHLAATFRAPRIPSLARTLGCHHGSRKTPVTRRGSPGRNRIDLGMIVPARARDGARGLRLLSGPGHILEQQSRGAAVPVEGRHFGIQMPRASVWNRCSRQPLSKSGHALWIAYSCH
jgi:hypothetical protein